MNDSSPNINGLAAINIFDIVFILNVVLTIINKKLNNVTRFEETVKVE
jgi:hypothetical protein